MFIYFRERFLNQKEENTIVLGLGENPLRGLA